MARQISKLSIGLGANVAPFVNAFKGVGSTVRGFVSQMGSASATVLKFTGIAGGIGAAFGALKGMGTGIGLAAELEQTQVAFQTMLRDGDAARAMMAQLGKFAAETPFEFPEIAKSAKSLLAFGVSAGDIENTLRRVGDISSGIGAPMGDIAEIFGKARVQGTLYAEDINQLVGRGIPVIQEFAKQLGVSEGQVKKLASEGKISFAMLDKAFTDLTSNGGQFTGMMAAQSKTLGGLWSTFTDNLGMSLAGIATNVIEAFNLKAALAGVSGFVETAGAWLTSAVGAWAPIFLNAGMAAWSAITTTLTAIRDWLAPIITSIGDFIARTWQTVVQSNIAFGLAVWSVIRSTFTTVYEFVSAIGEGIVSAWNWSMSMLGIATADTGSRVSNVFQGLGSILEWVRGVVVTTFVTAAYVIGNWRDVVGLAISAVMLGVVQAGAMVQHTFGTVVPAVLSWMANNWADILRDVAGFTATVLTNVGTNVGNFVGAVASLLTGGGYSFEWTGLTDGFESSLKQMPQIAAREIGALEQGLQQQFDAMQAVVGNGLAAALDANAGEAKAMTDGLARSVEAAIGGIPAIKPEIEEPKPYTFPTPELKANTGEADAAIDKTKQKAKDAVATIANIGSGSAEQWQRMARAALPAAPRKELDESAFFESPVAEPLARRTQEATRERPKREAEGKQVDGTALMTRLDRIVALLAEKGLLSIEETT